MNEQPTVSICIANYNGMNVIDDCLQSIQKQEGNISVEILIHDDASSDGSAAYIRAHYPEIKLIESENNVGFCVANNRMAAIAQGEYLLLLNNDAALYPDALQTLLNEAKRLDRPAILSLPQYDATSGELIDIGCLLDPFLNPVPNLNREKGDVGMVIGACLWISKSLWEELGGFPEWFGSIGEDLYLCCRARLAGHPVRALGASGYLHHVGASFGGGKPIDNLLATTYRRRALSERNKTFVMIVCCPLPLLAVVLPIHAGLLLLEGAAISLLRWEQHPLAEIYLPVFAACWRTRAQLIELRQAAQAKRRCGLLDFLSVFTAIPYKLAMLLRYGLPRLT